MMARAHEQSSRINTNRVAERREMCMSSKPERIGKHRPPRARRQRFLFKICSIDKARTLPWTSRKRMSGESISSIAFPEASRRDFKTALQENIFEVAASLATIEFTKSQLKARRSSYPQVPHHIRHKGMVYREPYGVTLIICPFNGPLVLSLRPAPVLFLRVTCAS
ncbi:MAG: Aldehyde dehydrogenase [Bryobacterales bacterium]|nr:Aldehyde dehydrogenase [Bryobacterales bacterium]